MIVDKAPPDELLRKIWWIASFPKAGNTLVRLFINAYVSKMPLDINAQYQYATIDQQVQFYQHVSAKPIDKCHPAEILYLRPAMLMHYVQLIAPRDACFKTHFAAVHLDGIPTVPPRLTKQAVYLVRDPRDVAASYARHSGKTIDETIEIMGSNGHIGDRGSGLKDVILSWSAHVNSWLDIQAFPVEVVKFEDILADKEAAFRRILPALGFREMDEDGFEFAMRQTSLDQMEGQEKTRGFREAKKRKRRFMWLFTREEEIPFFHATKSGYWREVLSRQQVNKIEADHRDAMLRVGYELSS